MKKAYFSALILSLAILTSAPALAADSGRIDLAPVAATLGSAPKVNINFGPAMISGFAESMRQSSPQLAEVLTTVSGLRLMVFENVDTGAAESSISAMIDQLNVTGWTAAVTVRDDDTLVDIYLKESADFVDGLVLLLRDGPDTAVIANIHGRLDPVTVGQLIGGGKAMDGFSLDGLMGQLQGRGN
ncbi:MAG: DUF4252 domain-containing protein [Wenzhouxiangella sp.]